MSAVERSPSANAGVSSAEVPGSTSGAIAGSTGEGGEGRRDFSESVSGILALQVLAFVLFVGIWELLVVTEIANPILVPAPSSIAAQLASDTVEIFTGGQMQTHFVTTLVEILVGFVMAVVIGVGLGAFMSEFRLFRRAIYPYVIAINSTPRIAFAPLFLIWFGFGLASKVAMVVAIASFPILVNTIAGLSATSQEQLKLMRAVGATRWQTFRKVRWPNALPYLFAGLESGIVFAAVGAVVAEFAGGNEGLGYVTLIGQELFQLDRAFSAIVLLMIQGFVLHRLVVISRRRTVFWQDPDAAIGV